MFSFSLGSPHFVHGNFYKIKHYITEVEKQNKFYEKRTVQERNIRMREDGSFYNLEYAKPITIKDNCWLASNVVVCGGVTIGEGCVIGAGSVVTKDIPPYSLAVGNPCRVIRKITEKDHMPDGIEKN